MLKNPKTALQLARSLGGVYRWPASRGSRKGIREGDQAELDSEWGKLPV